MKKLLFTFLISVFTLFIGCSPIEEATNTVNYVTEATGYAMTVTDFYQNVPNLMQQAASDPQAKEQLDQKVQEMKEAIESFNQLEDPPERFADYHDIIVGHNEQLLSVINAYMNSGMEDVNVLNNADLIQSMKDITSAVEDIKSVAN